MKKSRTTGTILVVIFLIIIVLVVAKKPAPSVSSDHVLTVGAILPLSGATAQYGEIFKQGLEYGLQSDPDIKIIYEDSKGDAVGATAAFQKLTTIDNVDMVISNLSKPSIPLSPIAKQAKVPFVMSLVAGINATNADNDYAYRLFWTTNQTGQSFVDRVLEGGIKHVAILQGKNEAAQSNADYIVPRLEEKGVTVTWETFQDTDTDFRSQLTVIKNAKPDVLAILAVPAAQWKGIGTQANELGIKLPIYDVFGVFLNPGTPEALGSLAEGVYTVATPFNLGEYKPEVRTAFIAKNNREPGGYESFGIDMASLLKNLVAANKTDRSSITDYLGDLKSFEGISGPYTIDANHNISLPPIRAMFTKGKLIESSK